MSADTCPCCGRPNISATDVVAATARLSPSETSLFRAIAKGRGEVVSLDVIHNAIWGLRADGGPDCSDVIIRRYVCTSRPKLEPLGFGIQNVRGVGYRLTTVSRAAA
jgi:DNA-binding response OmpR family regulator